MPLHPKLLVATHRLTAVPSALAATKVKGMVGVFSKPCDLCDRQRYLKHLHGRCIKCNFSSSFAKYFRKCINCSGIG